MDGKRVTTMLPREMYEHLQAIADEEHSNKNVVLRQAVAFFLAVKARNSKKKSKKG